jgi:hypothetical protein
VHARRVSGATHALELRGLLLPIARQLGQGLPTLALTPGARGTIGTTSRHGTLRARTLAALTTLPATLTALTTLAPLRAPTLTALATLPATLATLALAAITGGGTRS